MKLLLGVANGIILGIAGLGLADWRFWMLLVWMSIMAATWSYLDEREQLAKERYGR